MDCGAARWIGGIACRANSSAWCDYYCCRSTSRGYPASARLGIDHSQPLDQFLHTYHFACDSFTCCVCRHRPPGDESAPARSAGRAVPTCGSGPTRKQSHKGTTAITPSDARRLPGLIDIRSTPVGPQPPTNAPIAGDSQCAEPGRPMQRSRPSLQLVPVFAITLPRR